jgi:hypothetical protein
MATSRVPLVSSATITADELHKLKVSFVSRFFDLKSLSILVQVFLQLKLTFFFSFFSFFLYHSLLPFVLHHSLLLLSLISPSFSFRFIILPQTARSV